MMSPCSYLSMFCRMASASSSSCGTHTFARSASLQGLASNSDHVCKRRSWLLEYERRQPDNNNIDFFKPNTDKVMLLAEELVERSTARNILDLASGTGNPAIRLALAFPECKVHATGDASPSRVHSSRVLVSSWL